MRPVPVLRQRPGDKALARGRFGLAGRDGRSAHMSVEVEKGERFPFVEVGDDIEDPRWVLLDEIAESVALAA